MTMRWIVFIVSILIIAEGALFLFRPDILKSILKFFLAGSRIYAIAIVRIVLAVLFFIAARDCKMPKIIIAFGILMLVSGIIGLVTRIVWCKKFVQWWINQPLLVLRLMSILAITVGGIILYAA